VAFIEPDPTIVVPKTLLLTDLLGHGDANAFETTPAEDMNTNSTVLYRTGGDTNDNSADTARNSNLSTLAFAVRYISFKGRPKMNKISLNWKTSTEINNLGFEIQKSRNIVNFETIGRIQGNDYSEIINSYSYSDNNPFDGINYYRLKQKDFDGSTDYFKIISVLWEGEGAHVSLYSNPLRKGEVLQIQKSHGLKLQSTYN
jgi:hypothetical protein